MFLFIKLWSKTAISWSSIIRPLMGFRGFAKVCANRFLEIQHIQRTPSKFNLIYVALYLCMMREPVVNKFYTKKNLFLKFESQHCK